MSSKLLKNILIFFIILFIVILALIIVIHYNNKNHNFIEEVGEDVVESYGKNQSGGIDHESYFDVIECMNKYLNTINTNSLQYGTYNKYEEYVHTSEDKEIKQKIFNLLSKKYTEEKNITVENIYAYIKTMQKQSIFRPIEIALIQDGDIKSFLTYGLIESVEDYSVIDRVFVIVNINPTKYLFSIEPINEKYSTISEIKIQHFENAIIDNGDNNFSKPIKNAKDFPVEYIKIYKELALGAPEKLYDLLDKEYRDSKFGSLEKFKKYIEKNKTEISTAILDKYVVNVEDTKVRYICVDQYKNYYVINQNEILQDYTIMLDIYTKDIPETIEKYDTSEDDRKVVINIEKLINASKEGDYKYVYSKLDDRFKSTNFATQEDLEKYIKEKFNAKEDTIKYVKYEEITGVHVYHIEVTDKSENKTIKAKVVMDLKDNREFVFSFREEN